MTLFYTTYNYYIQPKYSKDAFIVKPLLRYEQIKDGNVKDACK